MTELTKKQIKELEEQLPNTYFVGFGFFKDSSLMTAEEAFAFGQEPDPRFYQKDVLSSKMLTALVSKARPTAEALGRKLFYFRVTQKARIKISKKEAEWLADNRARYQ